MSGWRWIEGGVSRGIQQYVMIPLLAQLVMVTLRNPGLLIKTEPLDGLD